MKTPLLALLSSALALGAGVSSAAGPTPRTPIRPTGECLVARQVLDWGVVDDRRLVVKSLGKRYYDIQLAHSCRDLNRRPYLTFRDSAAAWAATRSPPTAASAATWAMR